MRYFDAYRMDKWLFTRCGVCAALVAEIDQETHTEWHENAQLRMDTHAEIMGKQTQVLEKLTYRTKTGKVLTDAEIQALADEAEAGYDVSHLKERDG
jgi:hypothetical protein